MTKRKTKVEQVEAITPSFEDEGTRPDEQPATNTEAAVIESDQLFLGEEAATSDPSLKSEGGKILEIKSLDNFLRVAYGEAGKKLSMGKTVYESIERNTSYPLDNDSAIELIDQLALQDPLLSVPPRIMVHADDADAPPRLRSRIDVCIRRVLLAHPVFAAEPLRIALTATPDDEIIRSAFESLDRAIERISAERLFGEETTLKESERTRLLHNAQISLALLLASRHRWPIDLFVDVMYANIWSSELGLVTSRPRRAAIAESRSQDVLKSVAQVYEKRWLESKSRVQELEHRTDELMQRIFQIEAEVDSRNNVINTQRQEISQLQQDSAQLKKNIEEEQQQRTVALTHHVDDYETLRTRIIRLLDQQAKLLSDGLHALRNERLDVADEFVDRVLEAFQRERDQLREQEADTP